MIGMIGVSGQNVASYLVHDLHLDWRLGAEHFQQTLLDYDEASNWGNWALVAATRNTKPVSGSVLFNFGSLFIPFAAPHPFATISHARRLPRGARLGSHQANVTRQTMCVFVCVCVWGGVHSRVCCRRNGVWGRIVMRPIAIRTHVPSATLTVWLL